MPHAAIEYSANIEKEVLHAGLVNRIHSELIDCGLFEARDIKTRSYMADNFMVGEKGRDGTFIHITIYMLEGRTLEQKQDLSQRVLNAMQYIENVDSMTVDICDIVKSTYRKRQQSGSGRPCG